MEEKILKRADGGKPRHGDGIICPNCGRTCLTVRRTQRKKQTVNFTLIQPVDEEMGVVRLFDAEIKWDAKGRHVNWSEAIRLTLFKPASKQYAKRKLDIYYNQFSKKEELAQVKPDLNPYFDNKSNLANRRFHAGYLYDGGIQEALDGTDYARWIRVFTQMASARIYADYNSLLASGSMVMTKLVEMLFKGRFFRLLREESERISYWNGSYTGNLNMQGSRIEEVFRISDRQKINRIRELDGGSLMVEWMRWSEKRNTRIPDIVLKWMDENSLRPWDMAWLLSCMSVTKAMNYIVRQQRDSYEGKSAGEVISQYEDYMHMCHRMKRDTMDEMIYRPRELKRRHDEAVKELEEREAEITADEYSARFPGVEDVMEEIREKYEYISEQYIIMVPRRCVDIVLEGRALHHCAGATDRYFDRIKQHETYICFLRRAEEPDRPYYTIEVEPGGTIRQHRGYLDEEPEIEKIRPFLREWQQVVKRRMSEEDRQRARISAVKREENIEELKAKNNTRVLQGLMEDFMEAV